MNSDIALSNFQIIDPRDKETYEKDTVRVDFINEQNIEKMLKKYQQ